MIAASLLNDAIRLASGAGQKNYSQVSLINLLNILPESTDSKISFIFSKKSSSTTKSSLVAKATLTICFLNYEPVNYL